MNVYEMLDTLSDLTLEKSKQRMGEHNYAYALEWLLLNSRQTLTK